MRFVFRCLQLVVVITSSSDIKADPSSVFREIGKPEELKHTLEESDRVLVSFSVSWCLGCIRMDQDVWEDPAVALQLKTIDACVRPSEEYLDQYRVGYSVSGFPELILFEDGKEVGRLRGYWDAQRVIAWLNDPALSTEPGDPQTLPIGDVHDRAIDLLLEQRWEEAARFLSVFWVRSAHDEAMTDTLRWLREARYPSMLRRVAQEDSGREVIENLCSSLPADGPGLEADMRLVHDWLVLMLALDRTDRADAWIDRMLAHQFGRELLSAHEVVFDRLIEREMLQEAGDILSESVWGRWVARVKGIKTGDPLHDAAPAQAIKNEERQAPGRLGDFIRALRSAGRDGEADDLEMILSDG